MPSSRLFSGNEELGKKDDDHRPGKSSVFWQQRRLPHAPLRRNVKRVAFGAIALIAFYYFFKNMPTDLDNRNKLRPSYDHSAQGRGAQMPTTGNTGTTQPGHSAAEPPQHTFDGPIRFYNLATTLHGASRLGGADANNRNVLYAAASLKSASILLPIACEMAKRERNHVHFALMGRDDIAMDILKAANGVGAECNILFHDARPDLSLVSSDYRMEVSCSAAFNHIHTFIHPQATFIDGSGLEELFFLDGLKAKALSLGRTVIDLPDNAEQSMMWTTLLDSASLAAWNKVSIDILVHAPPSSSGSLIRLLQSLKKADFFSSVHPRLTIELPHQIDEPTKKYLERFRWPPSLDPSYGNLLTLHHRIPQHGLTPEENSIRFVEAFWPAEPFTSHVLVLSPQAELSPLFFHYLKYTMLEYKYSNAFGDSSLMSISLDLPSSYLNDSAAFKPPGLPSSEEAAPFIWQAPNSNAALFFGEKWVELHDFISNLLSSQHQLPTPTTLHEKQVSKTFPSWLEHILKLARARGYWTLYPQLSGSEALVTLHNELYTPPEEYKKDPEMAIPDTSVELTADPAKHVSLQHKEQPLASKSLLTLLPADGKLPGIATLPRLAWDGESVDDVRMASQAKEYSTVFRREIGGCKGEEKKDVFPLGAGDLFCLDAEKAAG